MKYVHLFIVGVVVVPPLGLVACSPGDSRATQPQPPAASPAPAPTTLTPSPDRDSGSNPRRSVAPEKQAQLDRQLIAAAWRNEVTRARRLVAAGADVNAKDDTEQSAYLIATSEGYSRLLELTLRHGADVNAKDSFNGTGLIRAAERGHHKIVRRLVQEGIELDHVNNLGWTALLEAVILGDGSRPYQRTVRILLAAGAGPLIADSNGVRPLQHAEAMGQDKVARILRHVSSKR